MELEDISFEDFQAYEEIRSRGEVNMLSPQVQTLAGISEKTQYAIVTHYSALCYKFPGVRSESS